MSGRSVYKEKGYLQHHAELSQFDDSAVRERQRREQLAVEQAAALRAAARSEGSGVAGVGAIPGNDGILYNPAHHSADYAGFVSRDALERAHFEGRTRESVIYTDHGVIPAPQAKTTDHVAGAGRKHYENDVRFSSREVVAGSAPLFADPTYYRQGAQDDRFESTAMAAQRGAPTQQAAHPDRTGRKHVAPAFEQAEHQRLSDMTNRTGPGGRIVAGAAYNGGGLGMNAYSHEAPRREGQLIGYRATAFKPGAPSMLAGIGSAVARNIDGASGFPDRPRPRESVLDARSREKGTHVLDVNPSAMPGYTGRNFR